MSHKPKTDQDSWGFTCNFFVECILQAQTDTSLGGFMWSSVRNARGTAVTDSLFAKCWTHQLFLFGVTIFKTNGIYGQRHGRTAFRLISNNFKSVYIDWYVQFFVCRICCSYHFEYVKLICGHPVHTPRAVTLRSPILCPHILLICLFYSQNIHLCFPCAVLTDCSLYWRRITYSMEMTWLYVGTGWKLIFMNVKDQDVFLNYYSLYYKLV